MGRAEASVLAWPGAVAELAVAAREGRARPGPGRVAIPSEAARDDDAVSPRLSALLCACPERTRRDVLRVAFLARVTPCAVVALTGDPTAAERLARLADAGLLLRRAAHAPEVLQFAPADKRELRELARRTFAAAELAELLWRALGIAETTETGMVPPEMPRKRGVGTAPAIEVFALGGFAVRCEGIPLSHGRKSAAKPLRLLRALAAFAGRPVSTAVLGDILWPDADGDRAFARLVITLHRARALLGFKDAIVLEDGLMSFNPARVWCDVAEFDAALLASGEVGPEPRQLAERIVALYAGPLLPECDGEPWVQPHRERLAAQFAAALAHIADVLELQGDAVAARALALQSLVQAPRAVDARVLGGAGVAAALQPGVQADRQA